MNPYLNAKVGEYNSLVSQIDGMQERAVAEGRDLTEDELRSVKSQSDMASKLQSEIKMLSDLDKRAAEVRTMAENAPKSTAVAVDRDPGHYRSQAEGGQHSFFGDLFRGQVQHEYAATRRLEEHTRANQTTSTVAGVIPPRWITDLFTTLPQQDASLANAPGVSRYEITNANPFYLPGQTAVSVVANQSSESAAITPGDAYDAAAAGPITPSTIVGEEVVSRQLLDGSTPAIDQLIVADLNRSYIAERELRIGAAIRAVGTALAVNLSDFVDSTAADYAPKLVNELVFTVRKALFVRPSFLMVDYDMMQQFLDLQDGNGRPLFVGGMQSPQNVLGLANATNDGWISGIPFVVSQGAAWTGGDAGKLEVAAVDGSSVVYFESPQLSFRYEEVAGPQQIKLGLWRYFAATVRQGTLAVKNVKVTDDVS